MSRVRVDNLTNRTASGAPRFTHGVSVSGVITATSFVGSEATFTGNVSVGGTLTYEDVTNIDSVGLITARSGIKIGAGQSISAVSGIVTYYGDGSQLSGIESGVSDFVASGTIANGATVVVNTDGTVSVVVSSGPSAGTPAEFKSDRTDNIKAAFDSNSNKIVLAYSDFGNYPSHTGYGKAIVGTVSGTSISFGSEVTFNSNNCVVGGIAFDSSSNKIVIAYAQSGAYAIVGTVSGTSISFGSADTITTNSSQFTGDSVVYDSNSNKVVVCFRNSSGAGAGTAFVGTVSGTTISFGTGYEFSTSSTTECSAAFDSSNNKVVIAYAGEGTSYGYAVVGDVSGTSISFGGDVLFEAGWTYKTSTVYDSNNNKIVIAYQDGQDSNHGKVVVGTVSGTSISFGSAVTFNSSYTDLITAVYDSTNHQVAITYRDNTNSVGEVIYGTVSGTSISFGTPAVFESATTYNNTATYDSSNNKVVSAWQDGSSQHGEYAVISATSTNLTSENYIGIAAESISDTATGKINVLGGVNIGQTGLTTAKTYYVQTDGTLATSAGNPSVVAGTSISDTKILVR